MFFKLKIQSVLNFVNYFQTAFFLDKVMNNYFQKLISYYRIFNKTSPKNKTNKKIFKIKYVLLNKWNETCYIFTYNRV